jgi:hypothetical protein
MMTAKCQNCHEHEAIWAMQFVGQDTPTYSRLGSHYRGFRVTKLCDECKRAGERDLEQEQEQQP